MCLFVNVFSGVEVYYIAPSHSGIASLMSLPRSDAIQYANKIAAGRDADKPRYADIFLKLFPQLAHYDNFTFTGLATAVQVYVL